jgi:uncharacterized protein (TIGR03435 family)
MRQWEQWRDFVRTEFAVALGAVLLLGSLRGRAQDAPEFEVATIKPSDPNAGGMVGFLSYPGGRVLFGHSSLKMMMYFAYDLPESRITGGPDWVGKDQFEVTALPPDFSESRTAKQPPIKATPSAEQSQMLQSLLADRFALKVHREVKQGPVYLLTLGSGKLRLQAPKDRDADSRFAVMQKGGGIVDGETFGVNVSMAFLAERLRLDLPVVDETGLKGVYDFHLDRDDPENQNYSAAVFDAMERLGLKLKRGTGPVETLVIDHVERPTPN